MVVASLKTLEEIRKEEEERYQQILKDHKSYPTGDEDKDRRIEQMARMMAIMSKPFVCCG